MVLKSQKPDKASPDLVQVGLPIKKQKKKRVSASNEVVGVRIPTIPKMKTLLLDFLETPLQQTKIIVNAVDITSNKDATKTNTRVNSPTSGQSQDVNDPHQHQPQSKAAHPLSPYS